MTGGAHGFDTAAALTILKIKDIFPQIKLILVLPCKNQARGWNKTDAETYNTVLSQADEILYTSERYYAGCMQKRNRCLVENSGYCICYLKKNSGGTKYTADYADKKGLKITMLT